MSHKYLIIVLLALIFSNTTLAQDKEVQARSEYMQAELQYGEGNFKKSIRHLLKVKQLFNGSNPKVQYLLVKNYVGLNDYKNAEMEIKEYFRVSSDSDRNYNEMTLLLSEIKDKAEEISKKEKEAQIQANIWKDVKKENTLQAYKDYMSSYPNGKYFSQANYIVRTDFLNDKIPPLEEETRKLRSTYKTQKTSGILLTLAGLGLGVNYVMNLPDEFANQPDWFIAAGGAGVVSGIFLWSKGNKNKKKYVPKKSELDGYYREKKQLDASISFNVTGNGVGLTLKF